MFVLTDEEKRVICFVMLAILIGVAVKEYRHNHPSNPTQTGLAEAVRKQPQTRQRHNNMPMPTATAP